MIKNEMLARIAAILAALDDVGGSPESMLYIFCGMDMDDWSAIRGVLVGADYVAIKGNYVTLTETGKRTARELNDAIEKRGKKQ